LIYGFRVFDGNAAQGKAVRAASGYV